MQEGYPVSLLVKTDIQVFSQDFSSIQIKVQRALQSTQHNYFSKCKKLRG